MMSNNKHSQEVYEKLYEAAMFCMQNDMPWLWVTLSGAIGEIDYLESKLKDKQSEIERLREFETLYKAGIASWNPVFETICNERDNLRYEIERLQAENEKVLAALKWFKEHYYEAIRAIGEIDTASLLESKNG